MNRPVLYWLLFAMCLLLIIPAMGWLTYSAMDLDRQILDDRRQTELARREAELQEKITSALYRMDWKMGPHIAREAAQPYYMYDSFYKVPLYLAQPGEGQSDSSTALPSPLLYEEAEFVKLHFQVAKDGMFTSPKRPTSQRDIQQAVACCDIAQPQLTACDSQLQRLREFSSFEALLTKIEENETRNVDPKRQTELVYAPFQIEEFVAQNSAKINEAPVPQQSLSSSQSSNISKSQLQTMRVQDRGGKEFLKRKSAYDDNTLQWAANQRGFGFGAGENQTDSLNYPRRFVEGVMRPIWLDGELLLARKVEVDGSPIVQGCWLDWEKIQQTLRDDVKDIIPGVEFEPLLNSDQLVPGRALVTLPAQVVVDTPALLESLALTTPNVQNQSDSSVALALILAWLGLALSAVAIGLLLYGVIRLSERRASFVSAVTHELRTPLTTFKMYSEMLADDMVPPEKQKQYASTLSQQSDRLSHLVENVLQFARLERGSNGNAIQSVVLSDELTRIAQRLDQRCELSGMQLEMNICKSLTGHHAKIELHSLEQILFNLIDNACKYATNAETKTIELDAKKLSSGCFEFCVRDYGPGVDPKFRKRLFQPFCKSDLDAANSAAGVGLGLALCQRMAASLGGTLRCDDVTPGAKFVLKIPAK